jgi:cell division protein FtsQ
MKFFAAKGTSRRLTKGATRKSVAAAKPHPSLAWVNRALVLVGVGVVLTVAVKGFVSLHAIPVEQIIVAGKLEHTKVTALEDKIRPALVGGFLNADLEHVRAELQSLPWVNDVSIRRRWPNALELHVVEQLPIARWGDSAFLNHEGLVFRPLGNDDRWATLPLLQGPDGEADTLIVIYQRLVEIFAPHHLLVEELSIDKRGHVEALLRGGITLVLGNNDHLLRLRRFVQIYEAELAAKEAGILRVDLRYQNGMAVAYRETGQTTEIAGL